jgi:hypothetical protein
MANRYLEMKKQHEEEFNNFPIAWAFNKEQFNEGMAKLGLEPTDLNSIVSVFGGGFIRRENSKDLLKMMARQEIELYKNIEEDTDGTGFAFEMLNYELSSHEYNYTRDEQPTLDALGLGETEFQRYPQLQTALKNAKIAQKREE